MCARTTSRRTHTEGQNQARATSTPTQRTTTPDARPFTAHQGIHATNTSFKCALTRRARCRRRPTCPRCFSLAVVDVGLFPFFDVQRANPPDSVWVTCRHPLGSSSALHNLIVLSIGIHVVPFVGHHVMVVVHFFRILAHLKAISSAASFV